MEVAKMKQLEKRFYARDELAEVLQIRLDNKNFARDVKNKLVNWGYSFEYSRKGAVITDVPTVPAEKLAEIMIRKYDLDIQVDVFDFASFIIAFIEVENFVSMPWGEREAILKEFYGVSVDERTLRNWCSKLLKTKTIYKSNEKTYWKTICYDGIKYREIVEKDTKDDEEMRRYWSRRKQLVNDYITTSITSGRKDYKVINSEAWKEANSKLWCEFGCCYYSCKTLLLSAFDDMEELEEVYDLVKAIAAEDVVITKIDISITSGIAKPDANGFVF